MVRYLEGRIEASSLREGNAGTIHISAPRLSLTESNLVTAISTNTRGSGRGGNIVIDVETLSINDGARIVSEAELISSGDAGTIHITASHVNLSGNRAVISTSQLGSGRGGNIVIDMETLSINDGASIVSESRSGSGAGGDIAITATKSITIREGEIATRTSTDGNAGSITIRTPYLELDSGAPIFGSFGPSISTQGSGFDAGKGGDLILEVGALIMKNGSRIDSGGGSGDGGDIFITATDNIVLAPGSEIRSGTFDSGKAGDITINAQQTLLIDQSEVRTSAVQADGGDVNVTASLTQLSDSQITTAVGGGDGSGGNISVDTNLGLLERSEIRADASGGPGGNITIQADGFITDASSVISASSAQSVDGTVSIQGLVDLSGSLAPLDPSFAAAAALQSDPCIGRLRGEGISRFTQPGRDRLPTEPGGLLPSPSGMAAAVAPPARQAAARLSQGQPDPASTLTAWHRDCVR